MRKSIMQNFSNCGDLDTLFNNKNGQQIVQIFKSKLVEKYNACKEMNIYYIIFICHKKHIYLTCFKWNI